MNKKHSIRFAARPLSAAVLMALATPAAFAAVTATQLPGVGYVVHGSSSVTGTVATNTLTINPASTAPVVIQWGGSAPAATVAATINGSGTAGFNIGAQATVKFTAAASKTAPILNIDATGNPSMILGTMTAAGAFASPVYVANANGIVVGASAVIDLPAGLGLINANENTTNAIALFTATGSNVAIDFTGATGGVTVSAGADLNGVSTGLLIAGAGNVNVNGAFVSQAGTTVYSINDKAPLTIDGGVGGYATVTAFTAEDNIKNPSGAFNSLASGSVAAGYKTAYYTDAANTSVGLNLGTSQSPYDANSAVTSTGGLQVLAYGNINVASGSNISTVNRVSSGSHQPTFEWTGTFTNNGTLNFGDQTNSTLIPESTYVMELGYGFNSAGSDNLNVVNPNSYGQPIYGDSSMGMSAGAFVNASTGLLNGGSLWFQGASFTNNGTIQLGEGTNVPSINIEAFSGNVSLGGTVAVVNTPNGTYASSAPFLNGVFINAANTAGQTVNIDTTLPTVGAQPVVIQATNVNVNNSITISNKGASGVGDADFVFTPYSLQNASAAPVSGSFVLSSGATISASGNLIMGAADNGAIVHTSTPTVLVTSSSTVPNYYGTPAQTGHGPAYTSFQINGNMLASGLGNTNGGLAAFGGTGSQNSATFNVNGSGSITAGSLIFNNLLGSVNNITTGQILANGFQIDAPMANGQPGTVNITVTADGAALQGFNVGIVGNATISSGDTVAVNTQTPAGNEKYAQYLYPANANSNLVVSASGGLTVDAGTGADNYGLGTALFQWPGLIYLTAGSGNLTATVAIANAYGAQAATGHAGVFFIANNINDNFPIYTNGNAGVVFAAPFLTGTLWAHLQAIYPYALSINGINPFTSNPGLPTVYFATPNPTAANANFSFQVLNSFTNGQGYQQENQTFLTLP